MIIDFHTHTFPDKIADKAISRLSKIGKITPFRDGTVSSLKKSMLKAGIDVSVSLPVATSPSQVDGINRLSAELNGKDGIFFAGAIHPDTPNITEVLDFIKGSGLFGIKIHPDYQGVYFNDERYIEIMREAAKRNLITVTHAGLDIAYPNDIHCTPDTVCDVLKKIHGIIDDKLVLAHLGGGVLKGCDIEKLIGKPIWLDTAFVLDVDPDLCCEIIKNHGSKRVVFATDSPWADQSKYVSLFNSLNLTEEEKNDIESLNAKKLLKIN